MPSPLDSNIAHVTVDPSTLLGKRGIRSLGIHPLPIKKELRAKAIVSGAQRKDAFASVDDINEEKILKFKERLSSSDTEAAEKKEPTREERIESWSAAFEYLCYAGVIAANEEKVPDPPKDMLTNGESEESGWLDNLNAGQARQLVELVLVHSGMIPESEEGEGNGSGASTPSAPESA